MIVKLAEKRGFCFGVEDAIELAQATLERQPHGTVHALGPVIHNPQVVSELAEQGLDQQTELSAVPEGHTVLIRSHGAPPSTLQEAEQRGLNVTDATCVLVKKAQNVVRQLHEEGYQVIMIGDANHPEVKGVIAYAPEVIVVDSVEELDAKLPRRGRLGIVAQTTHSPQHVARLIGEIAGRPFREMKVVNTLCLEVVRRQEAAIRLCHEVDVMFVLGGLHSANTREMAALCQAEGVPTYHLETWADFRPQMTRGHTVAGVTAGASTPDGVIQEFVERLQAHQPGATGS
jgi:(E)-4-hydroxy-3-methyl-but-2-enyl pyrophosphate reductase